ncbi:hypothetical protein [Kibdelosporangium philippinense]|uniref:hypothetical protein n=1 Tax=Kibdelosporangium philippinense TaxID=211113 RepID=UPI00361E4E06
MGTRSDTMEKIQDVALDLRRTGLRQTSLREIAEQPRRDKAALYYHFKTRKRSSRAAAGPASVERLDEISAWLADKEPTPENRRELLERYAAAISQGGRHFK